MFFTQDDYKKIQQWLTKNSVKDTEFNEANIPFNGEETITIVQGNQNKKVFLKDLIAQVFNLGISDFVNITDKYDAPNISLEEAIRLIPSRARKEGQVITFLDREDHWHIYQFKGVLNQWNVLDTWEDLFDWEKLIIDSILPDEEDLTKSPADTNGNSYLSLKDREYNPEDFSGLGRVILRKNIVEIEDPIYGKVKKNLLYQDMFTQSNTIYEIRYDFDLNGGKITIPENCVLQFEGGCLDNGTIIFKNTNIYNIGNLTIFRKVLIFGLIDNKHLSVKWFGLKPDDEDYSTDNWSILVNYVIPAAENTGKEIYVPNGYFYFNDTIRIINVELNCDGTLIYNGRIQNKALVIGNESNVVTNKTYTIKLNQQADIRQHYELSGSEYIIPENYGVEFINLLYCKVNIESVEGFAKEVTLIGDGNGFASNRIDIKRIGRFPYYCIKLKNKNNGYINENLFIGGELKTYESPLNKVQNYGIILDETSGNNSLIINNNVFLKQCSEHFYSAVKINYGRDNLFFGMRAEDCTHPMIVENRYSLNNVFVGNELSETIHTSSTIIARYEELFSLKTIRTDKVCSFNYKNGSYFYYGSNLLYYNGDSSYNIESTGLRGYKVKVYDKQTLKLESNIGTLMSIVCFDENNQKIQITQENYEEYIINMKNTYLSNGELRSTTDTLNDIEATFAGNVHSVFIGVRAIGSRITLLSSLQAELLNVDKMNKAYIVPQEAQGFDIGDSLWIETLNKYIFYTGTKWVDATGAEV